MLEQFMKALDLCYFEVTEAFRGLADEHVWQRPHEALLSIGELAGHIAYWEAIRFAGGSEDGSATRDLADCKISSPLLDVQFAYYTNSITERPTERHLAMTAEQVCQELVRVHKEAMQFLITRNPVLDTPAPFWGSTYGELLLYMPFHVAYHTGQMYSVRHLLGETPPDN